MIAPIISSLLWQHDCVVIPGFGALVANAVPSSFDAIKHRFVPPHKKLTFNKNIKNNDGLLANTLAEKNGISYQDAVLTISETVKVWNKTLENNTSISLDGIGTFLLNANKQLVFEPSQTNHFLFESFGLESFTLLPAIAAETKTDNQAVEATKVITMQPSVAPVATRNLALRYAFAGAAIAVGMLYLAWLPFNSPAFSGGEMALSDLNPFKPKPCETYKARTTKVNLPQISAITSDLVEIDKSNFGLLILDDENQKTVPFHTEKVTQAVNNDAAITAENSPSHNFYIVGGCFGEKENADKYIQQMTTKGYKPSLIDFHKGLYRVALNSFSSHEAAVSALENTKSTVNKGAWLLSK